ncbi:MAG: MFS transporter [Proteobacteria bacterium]|nr:MFS transporter [Pseudomonadota bacterium]
MDKPDNTAGRTTALIITAMSAFLTPLSLATVNVALPSIGKEFSMNAISLSWVAMAYIVAAAIFLVPFGRLADIYGMKRVFLIGTCIFTLSSFFMGITGTPLMLIIFRVVQGIGAAMLFGTGVAILSHVFPLEERGRVLGINVASVYLGLSFGPFIGGILTQHLGWRSIFFLNVPLGIMIIVSTLWKLKGDWADSRGEKFDFIGSCIYSAMIFAIMYGFSHLTSASGIVIIVAGFAGAVFFVYREGKITTPILDIDLFKSNRAFALSNIAALINYSATFAVGFLLSLYLQYIKGLSPQAAGFVLVSQPIVMAAFSPLAGRVSDKVEPRIVASVGMALSALGLFLFVFITDTTPLWFIIMSLVILGFGFAFFSSPNVNAIMSSVERRFYGIASSVLSTMRLLGQTFSMSIVMLIFLLYIGKVEILPAHYPYFLKSVRAAFIFFGVLCIAGIFASLSRGKVRHDQEIEK